MIRAFVLRFLRKLCELHDCYPATMPSSNSLSGDWAACLLTNYQYFLHHQWYQHTIARGLTFMGHLLHWYMWGFIQGGCLIRT
jgi:hypothetical protein